MSIFGKNDSHRLSNFLKTHIFWNFNHISRIYNQINYMNIWFPKVITILIMTAQVLFSMFFPKTTRTLMPLSKCILPNISRIKGNQTMKFGQLIEYNKRDIFLQKSCKKPSRETKLDLFSCFLKKLYMR